MDQFTSSHYFHLPSQSNIYTITNLEVANGPNKLLIATLKREIFYLEYQESAGAIIPIAKEVSFTYIPSGAEIISIDAFNKSSNKNEFVIGITIIKNNNNLDLLEYYLNIYSEWEENDDFNIENIAQNCLTLELNFLPYHLTHTDLITWENDTMISKETVFVLSGSDNQFHIYKEHTSDHLYKEVENRDSFPEALKTPSPIVWIDIYYSSDYSERYTAVVCECGYLRFTKVSTKINKLEFNFSTKLHNYLSKVKIFADKRNVNCLNMLVVGTILAPVLFEDVLTYGLSKYNCLPRNDYACVSTCCLIADIDFDGEDEILICNSAEEVNLYKYDTELGWCLEELKLFPSPIIKIMMLDLMGDGVKELVVLSMNGIHFLQYDFSAFSSVLSKRLNEMDLTKMYEKLCISKGE